MQVCEVMTREVETVAPDASLQAAAEAMEAMGVGSLPVCAGRRLVGTLTDRDIVVRGVATGRSPVEMTVRDCMTEDISWAFEEEDAEEVLARMRTLQAAPAMQLPVFLVLMTAPVYVPRDLLQGWIETASKFNPMTAVVEAGRGLMAGDPFHVLLAFIAAAGGAALLAVFARRGLRKAEAAG